MSVARHLSALLVCAFLLGCSSAPTGTQGKDSEQAHNPNTKKPDKGGPKVPAEVKPIDMDKFFLWVKDWAAKVKEADKNKNLVAVKDLKEKQLEDFKANLEGKTCEGTAILKSVNFGSDEKSVDLRIQAPPQGRMFSVHLKNAADPIIKRLRAESTVFVRGVLATEDGGLARTWKFTDGEVYLEPPKK